MRRALVVGCASCIWDDVKAAQTFCEFDAIYCVKLAGVHWPGRFQVWATLHPEYFDFAHCAEHPEIGGEYESRRAALGLPNGYEVVAHLESKFEGMHGKKGNIARRVSYRWCCRGGDPTTLCKDMDCPKRMNSSASSGIFAAKVALHDGFDHVVLAGIPMNADVGHFTRGKTWAQRDCFIPGFEKSIPHLMGRVKSMSGYTRDVLGAPSVEWLAGAGDPMPALGVMPEQTARG